MHKKDSKESKEVEDDHTYSEEQRQLYRDKNTEYDLNTERSFVQYSSRIQYSSVFKAQSTITKMKRSSKTSCKHQTDY